jgi:hypothetical protein
MFEDFTLPPHKEDIQLRTVRSNRTGTTKTVSLRTYTSPSNSKRDPRFERQKPKVDVVSRDAISKTTFGEHSRLKRLGIDSIEFNKTSGDLVIKQACGKNLKACLKNPGELDMVRNFFKILKRLR